MGRGVRQRLQQHRADGTASTTGNAVLYIVNIHDGALIRKIDTSRRGRPTHAERPGTPAVVDLDGDGMVDYVYAGDLFGNMWKFNFRRCEPGELGLRLLDGHRRRAVPLFVAKRRQRRTPADHRRARRWASAAAAKA